MEQTNDTAQQRDEYKVGPGCPPREHQWKKGQSGNPAGSPKAKTNLYKHISRYSDMTDAQLAQLDLESLTQSQKAALRIVQAMAEGKHVSTEGMAKYVIDREEGKASSSLLITTDNPVTPQIVMFNDVKQIAAVDPEQSENDDKEAIPGDGYLSTTVNQICPP